MLLKVIHNTNNMAQRTRSPSGPTSRRPARGRRASKKSWPWKSARMRCRVGLPPRTRCLPVRKAGAPPPVARRANRQLASRPPDAAGYSRDGHAQECLDAATTAGVSPLAGRYVDNAGKPLDDPTQQPNQEFRMMPIDMRLIIEQKDIPKLLTECARFEHADDVRAVRILSEKPGPFDPGGSSTGSDTPAAAAAHLPYWETSARASPGATCLRCTTWGHDQPPRHPPAAKAGFMVTPKRQSTPLTRPCRSKSKASSTFTTRPRHRRRVARRRRALPRPAYPRPARRLPHIPRRSRRLPAAQRTGDNRRAGHTGCPVVPAPAPARVPTPAPANGAGRSNPK